MSNQPVYSIHGGGVAEVINPMRCERCIFYAADYEVGDLEKPCPTGDCRINPPRGNTQRYVSPEYAVWDCGQQVAIGMYPKVRRTGFCGQFTPAAK